MFGGIIKKTHKTVIMDGSNPKTLRTIMSLSEMIAGDNTTKTRMLDVNHPTMIVMETRCTENTYDTLRFVLGKIYPGLCTFRARV
jgi:hypothetical protein